MDLSWLDAFPDMRVEGVQGVPSVQPQISAVYERTLTGVQGCACTPETDHAHTSTPERVQPKCAENRHSTPSTPCTPVDWVMLSKMPGATGDWAELIRGRTAMALPSSITEERWQEVLADAGAFLWSWGPQADVLGWTAHDLFAVPPGPERWMRSGLVALLRGRRVAALTRDTIVIANAKGAPHVYRRSPNLGAVMLWDESAFSEAVTNGGRRD